MDGTVSQQSINSIFLWSYSSDLQLEKILMDQIGIHSQMLYQLSHLILVIKPVLLSPEMDFEFRTHTSKKFLILQNICQICIRMDEI